LTTGSTSKELLARVRKTRSDYYWLPVWEGAIMITEGDVRGAVKSVNAAFERSPTSDVEAAIRLWNLFNPIENDPNVEWPSKGKE